MRLYGSVIALALCVSFSAYMLAGCSDDACGPGGCTPGPTIDNVWPNDDGREWQYDLRQAWWTGPLCVTLYDSPEEVPPVPTLDEIEVMLAEHALPEDYETAEGIYFMEFAGDSTTLSGVTAQGLRDSVSLEGWPGRLKAPHAPSEGFVLRLAVARPDLVSRIMDSYPVPPPLYESFRERSAALAAPDSPFAGIGAPLEEEIVSAPILIHGGVWEKTDEHIGTYGDMDTLLAYKFLEADLSPGHEFTHQLIPKLTGDVFLYCKMLPRRIIRVGGLPYPNAIECLYVIDYGISTFWGVSPGGEPGYCRLYDYGTVIYAPTIGPIYSYDRSLVEAGNDESMGVGEKTLTISRTRAGGED